MKQAVVVTGRLTSPRRIDLDQPVTDLTGEVEVVLVSDAERAARGRKDAFSLIAALPSGCRSKADIDRQLAEERSAWTDGPQH